MSKTKVVIVYSPGQARYRHATVPTSDDPDDWDVSRHLLHASNLKHGEAVLVVPLTLYQLLGPVACLERVLGRPAQPDYCAAVDPTGVVAGIVRADPTIDRLPGHTLYADPALQSVPGSGYHYPVKPKPRK